MEEQVEVINNHPASQPRISNRVRVAVADVFFSESRGDDDACSCLLSLISLCFFVSLILILGFCSSFDLVLGPNSSRLLRSNSFLVQDVQVKVISGPKHELMLYGFSDLPSLDINVAWLESHNSSVPPNAQKAWVYYLNQGAHINISYNITTQGPYPLILVIAQGRESLRQWIEDLSHPNITLLWKLIDGTGIIHQDIVEPSDYYITLANLNQIKMEVQLCFGIQALLYNTSGAYFKCSLQHGQCDWKLFFLQENSAVLTTSQDDTDNEWYVRLSYGPRWISYFFCSGTVILSLFMIYKIFTTLKSNSTGEGAPQVTDGVTERTSLLAGEDADDQSLGSSYDSVSNDEETDQLTALYLPIDGESDKHQRLCMICGIAQKDCFFLPCGHCATCFTCGNRLLNNGDTCPVCQRNTKKLRKIFSA